jgi:hypothetical protein
MYRSTRCQLDAHAAARLSSAQSDAMILLLARSRSEIYVCCECAGARITCVAHQKGLLIQVHDVGDRNT